MQERRDPLQSFTDAAIEWAAGARGQVVVDAAVEALVGGLDTPTLRVLAGSTRRAADEEAAELAPMLFAELGVEVAPRLSPAAIVQAARSRARHFLAGDGTSARALAGELAGMYWRADYAPELEGWMGYDDDYDLLESGVIRCTVADIDREVAVAAAALAGGQETARGPVDATPVNERRPRGRRQLHLKRKRK